MSEKQYAVSVYGVGVEKAIAWLEEHGYKNVCNLQAGKYDFSVIVVSGNVFFGTNATCVAVWRMLGNQVIPFETFITHQSRP